MAENETEFETLTTRPRRPGLRLAACGLLIASLLGVALFALPDRIPQTQPDLIEVTTDSDRLHPGHVQRFPRPVNRRPAAAAPLAGLQTSDKRTTHVWGADTLDDVIASTDPELNPNFRCLDGKGALLPQQPPIEQRTATKTGTVYSRYPNPCPNLTAVIEFDGHGIVTKLEYRNNAAHEALNLAPISVVAANPFCIDGSECEVTVLWAAEPGVVFHSVRLATQRSSQPISAQFGSYKVLLPASGAQLQLYASSRDLPPAGILTVTGTWPTG